MKIAIGLIEHIGDIVACEPVARYLRSVYPKAHISWVVLDKYRELIDSNPYIDQTVVIECLTEWIKIINHNSYDHIVDLHVNYRICPHCKIPLIKTKGNPFVNAYQWFDYGALLEAFSQGAGLPKLSGHPKLYLTEEHRRSINNLNLPERYFVIHRHSNDYNKDWVEENWQELIDVITDSNQMVAVEVGSNKWKAPLNNRKVIDIRGTTSLLETAEVIRRAIFFVGIDSGPAHMANALFIPCVILLGTLGVFREYNPFTGFYAKSSDLVRIVRNKLGPVKDIALQRVLESTQYLIELLNHDNIEIDKSDSDKIIVKPQTKAIHNTPPEQITISESLSIVTQNRNANSASSYEEPKMFAFYLPQFHPIYENNYGHRPGFTEWDNVIGAKPIFKDHYQPRIPGELGYYDLRSIDVIKEQIRLANDYGITGFCFYYYYFQGHRLLNKPIDNYIKSDIKAPFFFIWANENWTKRWDGGNNEVIISQNHSDIDDLIFIRELVNIFNDERYHKINGKPVLMIYKPHLFPHIKYSTELWREEAVRQGFPDLYLVMVDDWTDNPTMPRELGFDASYEIPSNRVPNECLVDDLSAFDFLIENFDGRIVDYHKFASFHMSRPLPPYKRFRTVMAPWDNTPRYARRAMIHVNYNNDSYQMWLTSAILDTYLRFPKEERILFIHSWNEWCEGTYIEPDRKYGRYLLEETKRASQNASEIIELSEQLNSNPLTVFKLNNIIYNKTEALNRTLISQQQHLSELQGSLDRIHNSMAWRILRSLRKAGKILKPLRKVRSILRRIKARIY